MLMMVVFLLSISVSTSLAAGQFRVGDQGEEIAEIQDQLVLLGYDVMADGTFGAATVSALLGKEMPDITHSAGYLANSIISLSMNYIGVPYVFGGTSPYGFDCSGYVQYVFANAGISIPRTADVQYDFGTPISTTELVSGDLVFFSTYTYGASHVGIYLGDNQFIHASSSRGVTIDSLGSSYWSSHYIGARRIL